MEYIEVDLLNPLTKTTLDSVNFEIEGYPFVVISLADEKQTDFELSRFNL